MSYKLTPQHIQSLNALLDSIPPALQHCDKCSQVPLDVAEQREQLLQQQKIAQAIKAQFAPPME